MVSLPECISWMTVALAESVAIVTLNLCTIIVFAGNRHLRKRSTYLVINLAVIDMLVGGVAVHDLFYLSGVACIQWKRLSIADQATYVVLTLTCLLTNSSLTNIAIMALERVHVTFWPLKHHVLKKWVHGVIIAVVWVTAGLLATFDALLVYLEEKKIYFILHVIFHSTCLLIICVSYSSIVIKVRFGVQPRHHGAVSRERKLTMTLLIVATVSVSLYLPCVVYYYLLNFDIVQSLPASVRFHVENALLVLFYANSLANPVLYAIRMPEYRSALLAFFRRWRYWAVQRRVMSYR